MSSDDKILFVQTFSKNWAMTGWRIGWLEAPPAFAPVIENLVQYSSSGVPVFAQRAAAAALDQGETYLADLTQRVHAAREVIRKNRINHAMAFDPGLTFEGVRHDMNPEMGLAARPGPGMAFMLVRFVHHLEALRRKSLGQLLCDEIGGSHAARLGEGRARVNACFAAIQWHRSNVKS